MEKHINMLSPRILSLYVKTIIINTLVLSKTSYISNVFPITAEITKTIHNNIFTYLWKNKKTEPIARKTIHLPKKLGGLNLLDPEAHDYAMRIKHLQTLNQKQKTPSCENIATYWLAVDIYNYKKEYKFLMNNSRNKTLNKKKHFYYNDIINYIKDQNLSITKIKPEKKQIYQKILQEGSKQHEITREKQWKKYIPNMNFKKIWKNTYKSHGNSFTKDLHYRLLHYSTKTNMYMNKCSKETDPKCNYCKQNEENIHLFIQCIRIKNIWKYYQTILQKLTGRNYNPEQYLLTLSVDKLNKNTTKLTLTIIQIIIFEIWTTRNNNKHDTTIIPQNNIITEINTQIRNVIQIHYKNHKSNGTINIFRDLFCISNALAHVQNGQLIQNLT